MASVKEIFFKGLCYTFTQIANVEEEIAETKETIKYLSNSYETSKVKYRHVLESRVNELQDELNNLKRTYKNDISYFGYSKADLDGKFKPYRMSDEELQKDYESILKEVDKNYNYQDLINLVKQFEKQQAI